MRKSKWPFDSDKWNEIVLESRRAKDLLGLPESDEDIQSVYYRVGIFSLQFNKHAVKRCGTDSIELYRLGSTGI
jgi:hypothetical protein